MNKKEKYKILNKFKHYVGLGDYIVIITDVEPEDNNAWAEVEINRFEQTVSIDLSDKLKKRSKNFQQEILVHELVHARIQLFHKKTEADREDEEEYMVNEITRGLLKRWQSTKK